MQNDKKNAYNSTDVCDLLEKNTLVRTVQNFALFDGKASTKLNDCQLID